MTVEMMQNYAFKDGMEKDIGLLVLGEHKCYSDAGFHDGYAINAEEFNEFRLIENSAGINLIQTFRKINSAAKKKDI